MPTYEFACDACGMLWELILPLSRFDETYSAPCPRCAGRGDRQPSAPAFTIKGYNARNGYARKD